MEPSSEPRRHAQSPMSLRLFYYTTPCLYKSCLGAASARHGRRLDHQGPPGTPHRSGAALGRPGRPPGARQGPPGPREGCVRGTASGRSRVKGSGHGVREVWSLRYNAGILSKNGGHHAIPHRKQPLEMIFSNFFQKSIFPLHT